MGERARYTGGQMDTTDITVNILTDIRDEIRSRVIALLTERNWLPV
jgi:hypothetical protein